MSKKDQSTLTVWIAGSTDRTVKCAQALLDDSKFLVTAVITPLPKKIDQNNQLLINPLHRLAVDQKLATVLIAEGFDTEMAARIKQVAAETGRPDFLLVVDFGYLIPDWLIQLPELAPINIHPSLLPRWRGASPGQFVLWAGENQSGISLIRVETGLDMGAIYHQIEFEVSSFWNSSDYYQASFKSAAEVLPDVLRQIALGLSPTAQPSISPTPEARQLRREDGFLPWQVIKQLMQGLIVNSTEDLPQLWQKMLTWQPTTLSTFASRAVRALSPWPGVWTLIPTVKGEKRMKILSVIADDRSLVLKQVQIDGQQPADWNQVKNIILEN